MRKEKWMLGRVLYQMSAAYSLNNVHKHVTRAIPSWGSFRGCCCVNVKFGRSQYDQSEHTYKPSEQS